MKEAAERGPYLDRFLTFIDAIVAIAITLLVLPLVDLTTEHEGSAADVISDSGPELFAFALSYTVIFKFWWEQHNMLRNVADADGTAIAALSLWVFTIVFLPFPTALAATSEGDEVSTRALYIGTMAVSAGALALLAWSLRKNPHTVTRASAPDVASAMALTIILLLALAISIAIPRTQYYPLFLLFLTGPLISMWRRGARRSES